MRRDAMAFSMALAYNLRGRTETSMTPDQEGLAHDIRRELERDAQIEAVWLAGSLGRDAGDEFSDVDVLVLAAEGKLAEVAARWAKDVSNIAPTVYTQALFGGRVLHAIASDWRRFDLSFIEHADLGRFNRRHLKPLFNRGDAQPPLRDDPPYRTSQETLSGLVNEFIRVLGLAPVGMGRGEYIVALSGIELLRQMTLDLMLDENGVGPAERGGALRRNPFLTAEQRQELESVPPVWADRGALLAARESLARMFLPRARRLAQQIGMPWPQDFEDAARRHLREKLELDF
jgi:predicted nucleotidyltransferase